MKTFFLRNIAQYCKTAFNLNIEWINIVGVILGMNDPYVVYVFSNRALSRFEFENNRGTKLVNDVHAKTLFLSSLLSQRISQFLVSKMHALQIGMYRMKPCKGTVVIKTY